MSIPNVDHAELARLIETGDAVVVDALPPMSYAHSHLPGAINLPPSRVDASARRRIPDLDAAIVVYCSNPTCEESVETANRLVALGYSNVRHYAGGKNEWRELGLPLERAGRPYVPG